MTFDLVVPVYNEMQCLHEFVLQVAQLRKDLDVQGVAFRLIMVDDGSRDGSAEGIDEQVSSNEWILGIHLLRNFGHQAAVTAGLDESTADFVGIIDADLQDPPALVASMLQQLRTGEADVVFGQRRSRAGERAFKKWSAHLFYRLIRWGSGLDVPLDTGDFRVMRRVVADALRGMPEHHRFLRAMVPWLGFRAEPFPYDRDVRFAGSTKYSLGKMIALASHAVFSFSTVPVRIVQAVSAFFVGVGSLLLVLLAALDLADVTRPSVAAWLASALVLQTGIILLAVGFLGGFLFRVQDEVKARPLYMRTDRPIGDRRTRMEN